jgi:hypothetical protein
VKARAEIRDGKIVVLVGKKIVRTFALTQEDKARSYVHGWNQLEK